MTALISKEIRSFLSSLTGYIVISMFLLLTGLFLWVFPGESNVLTGGYSTIEPLFVIAPWVFTFLIPAITMRSFAEEKRTGTIELLFTRPLTDYQIIWAKYLGAFALVIISLLPTLIYFYTVYQYGNPKGNIDTGATWGSFIGLLFLGSAFTAIGLFASAVTENQIVSFILAAFLCFIVYTGFDSLASLTNWGYAENFIRNLGINEHYISVSRGVVDSRDLVYFLSLDAFFFLLTATRIKSRKW
ncbi:MAG: gliding motility-associated ABC transporter permease subunit GldF [Sphingobacteriales bacterium JAD_PAG50586_3]|nr:MAG: gliding motility-associated ABC transporter permease subunit GldF [Sphingobacteriales bacterium JAD_PAG50586_3]